MKKRVLFTVLFISLLLSLSIAIAQNETEDTEAAAAAANTAQQKIDDAYACLESRVKETSCVQLSSAERIFALLAAGHCQPEVIADSIANEYWTAASPDIKTTAQAILALDKTARDTTAAENWLLRQNSSPEDMEWYLQVESNLATTCTITYDGFDYTTQLNEDKQFTSGAGSCLDISPGGWWLVVSPVCNDIEFEITCDEAFQTSLLFKREVSDTIHVSDLTTGASAGGRTTEQVRSACFVQGGSCDYEGTLWAALALDTKGYNIESYLPYLTTFAEENQEYLPDSFLYSLTGQTDYRNSLLLRQKSDEFWDELRGNKWYDTAIAMYALKGEATDSLQKKNTKDWLLTTQDTQGCWQGDVLSTAFLLASIWPRHIDIAKESCLANDYYCMSGAECLDMNGNVLSEYSCPTVGARCCDKPKTLGTCTQENGEKCNPEQSCVGGTTIEASDISGDEICCVGGSCEIPADLEECESFGGACRPIECSEGESQDYSFSCDAGYLCCMEDFEPDEGGSLWLWIVILIILIILVTLGIIYRDKLRPYWDRFLSKFKRGPKGPPGRPGPPGVPGRRPLPAAARRPGVRAAQRRILPGARRPGRPPARKPAAAQGDVGDVLKRLKEMSK